MFKMNIWLSMQDIRKDLSCCPLLETGFGVYHSGGPESSIRLREPSGVFTSEMSAIFVTLIQIRARLPGRYLIVTESMSSLKALTRWYMNQGGLLVAEKQWV
jgi:hypothetical protein